MNGAPKPYEYGVLGGTAFILSGAILAMVLETERLPLDGNPAWRFILAITYVGVAIVLFPWYREALYVLRRNWSLVVLLVLAALSSMWAEMPDLVLRKTIGLLGTTMFGIALAVRLTFEEQLRMFSWLFRILAVLSLACVVLMPSYGISSDGEWMGVFDYKNAMGSALGLSLLVEWQLPAVSRFSKILKVLAMSLSAFLLVKSDSVTPVVALAGAVILLNIYKFAALRMMVPLYAVVVITAIVFSAGLIFVLANGDSVMGLMGRSSNLTGRTEIWTLVLSFIPQKPILGYGYSGFWLGASPESLVVNRIMRSQVMYSHNGYLEMFLTLGVVGFLLTFVLLGSGVKRALYLSRQQRFDMELWPIAFLLYFILHNMGECSILLQGLEWAMCVSCIAGTDLLLLAGAAEEQAELPLFPAEEAV